MMLNVIAWFVIVTVQLQMKWLEITRTVSPTRWWGDAAWYRGYLPNSKASAAKLPSPRTPTTRWGWSTHWILQPPSCVNGTGGNTWQNWTHICFSPVFIYFYFFNCSEIHKWIFYLLCIKWKNLISKKKKIFFCSILSRISHTSVHCNSFIIQLFICFYLNMEITFVFCLLQAIVRENQEKFPAEIQPFTFPKDKTFKWE